MNKIGVIVDSFKLGTRDGILKAREIGAEGLQLYAVRGDMAPENLSSKDRRELLDFIKSNGLEVAALCGDLGGHGFSLQRDNDEKIERSKRIMDLAKDLETTIVTTHIGVVPHTMSNDRYKIMQEACNTLGEYGEQVGADFAIETGPEIATTLKGFLDGLSSKGVKVNYDPANLVMVTGDDPVQGVYTLKDYIVHTHAKDGIKVADSDPNYIYQCFAEGLPENFHMDDYFKEVPLGYGRVNFEAYMKALKDIGYKGYLTIEREVGENPAKDIKDAVRFLQGLRGK